MRIIAGHLKGRRLLCLKGMDVRPTTDKVKEAIFSMVAPYLQDAVVVDLFAGTGNLGLEAISRGAKRCYFCDKSRTSLSLTKENVSHCQVLEQAVFLGYDFEVTLKKIPEKVDLIFLDPPYDKGLASKAVEAIIKMETLNEEGLMVIEHSRNEEISGSLYGMRLVKERHYGTITISIFQRGEDENE